jgi:hypothetical protein
MSDPKWSVRYLGYRTLSNGGRGFDFSYTVGTAKPTVITIEAASAFFQGIDRIALQEAAGICYETVKCHLRTNPTSMSDRLDLTPADVAQHRTITKISGSRRWNEERSRNAERFTSTGWGCVESLGTKKRCERSDSIRAAQEDIGFCRDYRSGAGHYMEIENLNLGRIYFLALPLHAFLQDAPRRAFL